MAEGEAGEIEPVYLTAEWILSFSAGASPEDVAGLVKSTIRPA